METKNPLPVKSPDTAWLNSYFAPSLLAAKAYKIDTPEGIRIKLDQNESPWDWPAHLKQKVLERVGTHDWNRYPDPMATELTASLANYLRVSPDCLLTSPGSNHMITLVMDSLAKHAPGKVVIARPIFPLFESYAQYAGIPYETWNLDESFQYRPERLPDLPEGSIVFFASPNNPTGTSLSSKEFRSLLQKYPKVLFIADEAYYEFDDDPYTELLRDFGNFLILRTLSKTMGAAGIRIGYALGAPEIVRMIEKLRVPYLLNWFSLEAAKTVFHDSEMQAFIRRNIANARSERDAMHKALSEVAKGKAVEVFNSKANFLLLRWADHAACQNAYRGLLERGILVRNISGGPGLQGCLRVTMGLPQENAAFVQAIKEILT